MDGRPAGAAPDGAPAAGAQLEDERRVMLDYLTKTALAIGIVHLKTYRTEMIDVWEDGHGHQEGVAG